MHIVRVCVCACVRVCVCVCVRVCVCITPHSLHMHPSHVYTTTSVYCHVRYIWNQWYLGEGDVSTTYLCLYVFVYMLLVVSILNSHIRTTRWRATWRIHYSFCVCVCVCVCVRARTRFWWSLVLPHVWGRPGEGGVSMIHLYPSSQMRVQRNRPYTEAWRALQTIPWLRVYVCMYACMYAWVCACRSVCIHVPVTFMSFESDACTTQNSNYTQHFRERYGPCLGRVCLHVWMSARMRVPFLSIERHLCVWRNR
jgi:hypothetical protein